MIINSISDVANLAMQLAGLKRENLARKGTWYGTSRQDSDNNANNFFLVRTAFEGTKRIDIALSGIFGTRVVKPITLGTIDTLAGILNFFLKKLQLVFILPCVSSRSL